MYVLRIPVIISVCAGVQPLIIRRFYRLEMMFFWASKDIFSSIKFGCQKYCFYVLLDKYGSKHTGSQTNIQAKIGGTYKRIRTDGVHIEYTSKPRATHNLAHSAKSGNQCVTELVTHRKLSLR